MSRQLRWRPIFSKVTNPLVILRKTCEHMHLGVETKKLKFYNVIGSGLSPVQALKHFLDSITKQILFKKLQFFILVIRGNGSYLYRHSYDIQP